MAIVPHLWQIVLGMNLFTTKNGYCWRIKCIDSAIASVKEDVDSEIILKEKQGTMIKAFVDPIESRGIFFPGSVETRPIITAQWSRIRLTFLLESEYADIRLIVLISFSYLIFFLSVLNSFLA